MKILKLLFIVAFAECSMDLIKLSSKRNQHFNVSKTQKCLFDYILQVFSGNNIMYYHSEYPNELTKTVMNSLLYTLFRSGKYTLEMSDLEQKDCKELQTPLQNQQYLIYTQTPKDLDFVLASCLCSRWPAVSSFIVIMDPESKVSALRSILRKNYVYNVSLISMIIKNNSISGYHSKPRCADYKDPQKKYVFDCSATHRQVPIYDYIRAHSSCNIKLGVNLLPPYTELSNNNKNYSGNEFQMLKDILRHNKLVISDQHVLGSYDEETNEGVGLIKDLVDKKVDIVFGGLIFGKIFKRIEASYPLLRSYVLLTVPKTGTQEIDYFRILQVFPKEVWLSILVLNIIFVIITYVIVVFKRVKKTSLLDIIFNQYQILLGNPVSLQKTLRFLCLSWILCSITLRCCYLSHLVKHLEEGMEFSTREIKQSDDICVKNYTILLSGSELGSLAGGYNASIECNIPKDNFVLSKNPLQHMYNHLSEKNAVYIDSRSAIFQWPNYRDENGNTPFDVLFDKPYMVPISYYFRQGDPLIEYFRIRGMHLAQNGLLEFYVYAADTENLKRIYLPYREKTFKKLSMRKMAAVFALYLCGVAVSTVVLLTEVITFYNH